MKALAFEILLAHYSYLRLLLVPIRVYLRFSHKVSHGRPEN